MNVRAGVLLAVPALAVYGWDVYAAGYLNEQAAANGDDSAPYPYVWASIGQAIGVNMGTTALLILALLLFLFGAFLL